MTDDTRTLLGDVAKRPPGGKTLTPGIFCPDGMEWATFHQIVLKKQRVDMYTQMAETAKQMLATAQADLAKHSPEDVERVQHRK